VRVFGGAIDCVPGLNAQEALGDVGVSEGYAALSL
jgi:hypothetical protein